MRSFGRDSMLLYNRQGRVQGQTMKNLKGSGGRLTVVSTSAGGYQV